MSEVLITGGSGMLGRMLMTELRPHAPVGTGYTRARNGLVRLDLNDHQRLNELLDEEQPKIVIHTAAERRPDASERDPVGTRRLNVEATGALAAKARQVGAWMLYLSTDYVFDGTAPPYRPEDKPHPLNFYGQTKLEGEAAMLAETQDAAVLRVGVLFGCVESPDESAVTALYKDVCDPTPKVVDDWGQRYPTFVDDVAVVCRQLAARRLGGNLVNGIFHWCGKERYTKFQQTLLMGEILGLPTNHLRPDPKPPGGAPRPRDCQLDCSALEGLGVGQRTPFREALQVALFESGLGGR